MHSVENTFQTENELVVNASPLQVENTFQTENKLVVDALSLPNHPHGTKPGSLAAITQNFKSVTTRKINRIRKTPGQKLWQRNYYEHIIRNENDLNHIREYIINNPLQWELDNENPNRMD